MCGNNWRHVSIYGGVLSLFVKFSQEAKKSSPLGFTYLEKKNRKIWKIEKLREKNVEIMGGKNSAIRMTLSVREALFCAYVPVKCGQLLALSRAHSPDVYQVVKKTTGREDDVTTLPPTSTRSRQHRACVTHPSTPRCCGYHGGP